MPRIWKWTSIATALPAIACGSAPASTDVTGSTGLAIQENAATLTEFSVRGAAQGTFAVNTNLEGSTTGYWVDANTVYHGFVRELDGRITTIDAPGAGATAGASEGTVAYAINLEGTVAGEFQDTELRYHSFVRGVDGTFDTFDVPGAGTGANQGTLAANVNVLGEVAGYIVDSGGIGHGFVRSRSGISTTFDAPGSSQIGLFVALESGLSDAGATTGWYYDSGSVVHGFVRGANGRLTSFDAPSAAGAGAYQGTYGGSINPEGTVAGGVLDANNVYHGFVRFADGTITEFQAPGAGTGANTLGAGTFAVGIDGAGTTAGYFFDGTSAVHGFTRSTSGSFAPINARGAITTAPDLGTVGEGLSPLGLVPGYYFDTNGLAHGFVWAP